MVELLEYTDTDGRSPFADWFNDLDASSAAKIATAVIRLEQGNFSNAKGVGAGVLEYRIDSGPVTGFTLGRTASEL